jgi:hypothetical protein
MCQCEHPTFAIQIKNKMQWKKLITTFDTYNWGNGNVPEDNDYERVCLKDSVITIYGKNKVLYWTDKASCNTLHGDDCLILKMI